MFITSISNKMFIIIQLHEIDKSLKQHKQHLGTSFEGQMQIVYEKGCIIKKITSSTSPCLHPSL